MDYQQTLDYLYSQLPMFTRIGAAAYKKDLHNTLALCTAFDHPENQFRSIHIAGTNGKGSTSHMLAAIFHEAGYKTGLYTSPHLKDFRERIKVSGTIPGEGLVMVPQAFVVDFTQRAKPMIAALEPSFFELTVVMAFEFFAEEKVDIAIIETGLGGRLDSTNVITPELSVITNIGWDHMSILGDSLASIAFEKAGIIKPSVPVVIGESLPETKPVFVEKALAENAAISFAEDRYELGATAYQNNTLVCDLIESISRQTVDVGCDLSGLYQHKNIRTVFTAVDALNKMGFDLPLATVQNALRQVKKQTGLRGRWEQLQQDPHVILDVGHNEDGIRQVLANIKALEITGQVRIVMGMVKDKDIEHVLRLFPIDYRFYFTNAHLPRALPATELQAMAARYGLLGDAYDDVNMALARAKQDATREDCIIVCGSVFVVGEVE